MMIAGIAESSVHLCHASGFMRIALWIKSFWENADIIAASVRITYPADARAA